MPRDTEHRIKVVGIEEGTDYRTTHVSDGRQGVVAWRSDNVIYLAQVDGGNQTTVPSSATLETVEPDWLDEYVQSMLDNGWTISEIIGL